MNINNLVIGGRRRVLGGLGVVWLFRVVVCLGCVFVFICDFLVGDVC